MDHRKSVDQEIKVESEKNQDELDYKTLLANAKQVLKVEYHKSAALASQLQAIKTQLEL